MGKATKAMKAALAFVCAMLLAASFAACGADSTESTQGETQTAAATEAASGNSESTETTENETEQDTQGDTEDTDMTEIKITAGGKTFYAALYDTQAAREFAEMLPITVDMSELHGNEKYYYMQESLTADASRPGTISTGDLMLYGTDCLVLFYEDFSTSYAYTPLGRIDDAGGLAQALGNGSVRVTFELV